METKQYDITQLNISPYDNIINNNSNITLTASSDSIPISSNLFTITIVNNSDSMVSYGYFCQLETRISGKWYIVPLKKESAFPANKINLYKHTQNEFPIYLNMFECYPGEHRVILECSEDRIATDNIADHDILVSLEFNLNPKAELLFRR